MANVKGYDLNIDIKKDGEWYLATCPAWSDCYAQGLTPDEATSEIIAVASSLIELYDEENLTIPLRLSKEASVSRGKISFTIPVFATA